MGRPPIGKKAMTPAQRQKRRRRILARGRKQQELVPKREENAAKYRRHMLEAGPIVWMQVLPVRQTLDNGAEELATQVLEAIALQPDLTVVQLLAALARLAGVEPCASS